MLSSIVDSGSRDCAAVWRREWKFQDQKENSVKKKKTSSHRRTSSSSSCAGERFKLIFFFTAAVATSKWIKFNELEVERD